MTARRHSRIRAVKSAGWDYDLTGGTLPPVLSIARSSLATYVDASGMIATAAANTARFSRDPITHSVLGLLIEPQATYLPAPSEDVSASPWAFGSGLTSTPVTADTALRAADSVNRLGGGTQAFSSAQIPLTPSSSPVTQHWLIRNVDAVASRIVYRDNVAAVQINLSIAWASATAGAAISSLTPSTAAGVVCTAYSTRQFPNGWWLVTGTFTFALNAANALRIDPAQTTLGRSVDVAAAWATYSADPQSYMQITGTAITRDADAVICSDTSRPIRVWSLPLNGGAGITTDFAAGAPLTGLYGRWTRIAQL